MALTFVCHGGMLMDQTNTTVNQSMRHKNSNERCLPECMLWVEHGPAPHCLPGCRLGFDLIPMTEEDLLRDGQRAGRTATMDLDAIVLHSHSHSTVIDG